MAINDELLFGADGFSALADLNRELTNMIDEALSDAKALKSRIEAGSWQGEAKREFTAFLDLVVKYHEALSVDVLSHHGESMDALVRSVEQFLPGFIEYNNLS
jgi:hypothetical protein